LEACVVLEGFLGALQLEAMDYSACSSDIDPAFAALESALSSFEEKKWLQGLKGTGVALSTLADAVKANKCDLPKLAESLEMAASQIGAKAVANAIGATEQVLVEGSDVTLELKGLIANANAGQWEAVGNDLGDLSSWLNSTGCNSVVCQLAEGLLEAMSIPVQNLEACESDLSHAEQDLIDGAKYLSMKQYKQAMEKWSGAVSKLGGGLKDCGVVSELNLMQEEASVLGLSKVM